jgi:hypothetical protein
LPDPSLLLSRLFRVQQDSSKFFYIKRGWNVRRKRAVTASLLGEESWVASVHALRHAVGLESPSRNEFKNYAGPGHLPVYREKSLTFIH